MTQLDDQHCSNCADRILEALYQLNIEAKRHAESAVDAYDSGWKKLARIQSQKKKALYSLKRHILGVFVGAGCVETVESHRIDGRRYFCLQLGDYSFHTPISEWQDPQFELRGDSTTLDSFNAGSDSRSDKLDSREALHRLTAQFESPNHH